MPSSSIAARAFSVMFQAVTFSPSASVSSGTVAGELLEHAAPSFELGELLRAGDERSLGGARALLPGGSGDFVRDFDDLLFAHCHAGHLPVPVADMSLRSRSRDRSPSRLG
jgi:hypothetical protein